MTTRHAFVTLSHMTTRHIPAAPQHATTLHAIIMLANESCHASLHRKGAFASRAHSHGSRTCTAWMDLVKAARIEVNSKASTVALSLKKHQDSRIRNITYSMDSTSIYTCVTLLTTSSQDTPCGGLARARKDQQGAAAWRDRSSRSPPSPSLHKTHAAISLN